MSVNVMECGELLHEKKLPQNLKGSAYKSYVRPEILHGSEAWWLKKARLEFHYILQEQCVKYNTKVEKELRV